MHPKEKEREGKKQPSNDLTHFNGGKAGETKAFSLKRHKLHME